jgi:hypothetical protein
MKILNIKILHLIFVALCLSSCSSLSFFSESSPENISSVIDSNVAETQNESLSPLSLIVKKVESSSIRTKVIAEVRANTSWDVTQVSVRFSVFKDGILEQEAVRPVKDFIAVSSENDSDRTDSMLKVGQILPIQIELPVGSITDYQLTLSWGDDAEISAEALLQVQNVKLVDLGPDESCDTYYCDHKFAVEAELLNSGQFVVTQAQVQLNLVQIELRDKVDLGDKIVEELLVLQPLSIAPKARQKIRLKINQPLPAAYLQQFMAQIRIVNISQ